MTMKTVHHPAIPEVSVEVDDKAFANWIAQGWLPEPPADDDE